MQHAFIEAAMTQLPSQHRLRLSLHNEVDAARPEPMGMPMALSHVAHGLQRRAARCQPRAHGCIGTRPPSAGARGRLHPYAHGFRPLQSALGTAHQSSATWTFMRSIAAEGGTERDPEVALDAAPQQWFAELPGECLACLHLWVLPAKEETVMPWLRHVLHEETLVASTVARWLGRGVHRLFGACRWLLPHGAAGRWHDATPLGPLGAVPAGNRDLPHGRLAGPARSARSLARAGQRRT